MAVKMSGAEWKRFFNDESVWSKGAFMDDTEILVDGKDDPDGDVDLSKIDDNVEVTVRGGAYFESYNADYRDLVKVIREWQIRQTFVWISVEIPKGKEEELAAFVKSIGGKIKA